MKINRRSFLKELLATPLLAASLSFAKVAPSYLKPFQHEVLDLSQSNVFHVTLTSNKTIYFVNGHPGDAVTVFVKQDASGNRLLRWANDIQFSRGGQPILSLEPNAVDQIALIRRNNGKLLAFPNLRFV